MEEENIFERFRHLIFYHKSLFKPLIFAILVYLIIPLIFYLLEFIYSPKFSYNFYSFTSYSFILLAIISILRKEVFYEIYVPDQLIKKFLFGFFTYMSFLAHFMFKYRVSFTEINYAFNITSSMFSYLFGIIFLGFFIFGSDFLKRNFKEIFSVLSILSLYYVLTSLLWSKWIYFSNIVGKSLFWVLSLFVSEVSMLPEIEGPLIILENFNVSIGAPCSGIDSLSIFLGIFLILILYEHQSLNKWRLATVFLIGLISVLALNLLRVASIVLLGTIAPEFALGIFHSQIGWLFFIIFIVIFVEALYWWMEE